MAVSSHLVVGIAGGSGSGKTTLSREVVRGLGQGNVTYVSHEFYYRDLSHLPFEERANVNFDHPDALETSLLVTHLTKLKAGEPVEMPIYDFAEHTRREESRSVESMGVIIIEGILIFCHAELRDLDVKIFVDTVSLSDFGTNFAQYAVPAPGVHTTVLVGVVRASEIYPKVDEFSTSLEPSKLLLCEAHCCTAI